MLRLIALAALVAVAYCDLKADLQAMHDEASAKPGDDAIMNKYLTEETKFICPEGTLSVGIANIKKRFEEMRNKMGEVNFKTTVEHVVQEGDVIIDIGSVDMTPKMEPEARRHKRDHHQHAKKMSYMSIWKKTGDSYKIIAHGGWLKKGE